jgi:predicted 3-demethylubiquinone-9 3-methyltransferase (glyoxalase superfamily)
MKMNPVVHFEMPAKGRMRNIYDTGWQTEQLTPDEEQESVCGWLKDKFDVSWQVSPTVLGGMLRDNDKGGTRYQCVPENEKV